MKSFQCDRVVVVDIEELVSTKEGKVFFLDKLGRQLYQDPRHLSAVGADLVKAGIVTAIESQRRKAENREPHASLSKLHEPLKIL